MAAMGKGLGVVGGGLELFAVSRVAAITIGTKSAQQQPAMTVITPKITRPTLRSLKSAGVGSMTARLSMAGEVRREEDEEERGGEWS